ncbi:MAG: iron-sulfur cluster assembly scaffold protein, partial [Candidatus Cloacimonetes bacterium]|nr:iron-sulfur cluster assembly scaffold protein [Candidatus Cloacimonadota bacterium]
SEKVIEHFQNPHNVGKMDNPDASATEGSPACGDQLSVYLKVDPQSHEISDIKFQSYGCASNIATASIITDMAIGKTIEDAKKITWKQAADALGGLPPIKMHCSVLAVDALRSAIKEYEKKKLGKRFDEGLNKKNIEKQLNKIIYGKIGVDIISLRLVKYIGVDEKNNILIEITLKKDDPFLSDVKDEIKERLHTFPNIGKIKISLV